MYVYVYIYIATVGGSCLFSVSSIIVCLKTENRDGRDEIGSKRRKDSRFRFQKLNELFIAFSGPLLQSLWLSVSLSLSLPPPPCLCSSVLLRLSRIIALFGDSQIHAFQLTLVPGGRGRGHSLIKVYCTALWLNWSVSLLECLQIYWSTVL